MRTLRETNLAYLQMLDSTFYNVLIDHTYNTVTIYESANGLNPIKDLGEDYKDWMSDDLFTYMEMTSEELEPLVETHKFDIVWDADYRRYETHGY